MVWRFSVYRIDTLMCNMEGEKCGYLRLSEHRRGAGNA
jgi:hypothetical protein